MTLDQAINAIMHDITDAEAAGYSPDLNPFPFTDEDGQERYICGPTSAEYLTANGLEVVRDIYVNGVYCITVSAPDKCQKACCDDI